MRVARLSVTPIKGTRLQDRTFIDLDANGVADDRRFYVIDAHGAMVNGKKAGRLVQVDTEYERGPERLVMRFPEGPEVAGVWAAGEPVTTNFYGRPVAGHTALGPWAEALSKFVGQTVRLVAVDRLGDAVDVHPVTVVSEASLESLRGSRPGAERLDYRRFRMLVELDGVGPHEEDSWAGRRVRIGAAAVDILGTVGRCIVTSQSPDSGEVDFDTLKTIQAYRRALAAERPADAQPDDGRIVFGMYGQVAEPGRISVGDSVALVP